MAAANLFRTTGITWFELKAPLLMVPALNDLFIPDADLVVATAWPTAYYVRALGNTKGTKVYYIQHREIDSGPPRLVDYTYLLPLRRIALSRFTAEVMMREFGAGVETVVPVGVDLSVFFNEKKTFSDKVRILMYYTRTPRKGLADGLKVIEIVRSRIPSIEVSMYGHEKPFGLPGYVRYHERPTDQQLRLIYASSDIFLYPSRYEGFGLPPMEAMACKCAVVTTSVGAVQEYAVSGQTAFVSSVGDIDSLAAAVLRLARNRSLRKAVSLRGYERIKRFGWEEASARMEKALYQILKTARNRGHNQRTL